jgi:hypothetical protein
LKQRAKKKNGASALSSPWLSSAAEGRYKRKGKRERCSGGTISAETGAVQKDNLNLSDLEAA